MRRGKVKLLLGQQTLTIFTGGRERNSSTTGVLSVFFHLFILDFFGKVTFLFDQIK